MDPKSRELRFTFDEVASVYDKIRPNYPPRLFQDLAMMAGLRPGGKVLEIGCGTGQATKALASLGYRVTAVDLGENMTRLARRNLARFPFVSIECSLFEEWPLPDEPFDMVFSATAFHWIDPTVGAKKAAAALGRDGLLAIVSSHHVQGGSTTFFESSHQCCYDKFGPKSLHGYRLKAAADIPPRLDEYPAFFGAAAIRRYELEIDYSTQDYLNLLSTYSDHRSLDPTSRARLFDCIANVMAERYQGRITKRYMIELAVSKRL